MGRSSVYTTDDLMGQVTRVDGCGLEYASITVKNKKIKTTKSCILVTFY